MKKHNILITFLIATSIITGCTNIDSHRKVRWISSNPSAQWQIDTLELKDYTTTNEPVITIFSDSSLQTIDGFGACFNELGWEALNLLPKNEQKEVLESLFDTIKGCKFNLCRMPIGANDYAIDWYSHNETPEDFNMDNFSIARDKERLIPYIREAHQLNPNLQIWGSPWCPPSWMKKNKHYACQWHPDVNDLPEELSSLEELVSRFIMEPEYLQAYAIYFAKFIEAYEEEGIEISAVHVQNEPNSSQKFPSCVWKPKDLGILIADYLAPEFKSRNIDAEIWVGTIERPQIERIDSILQYKNVMDLVEGIGFQWAGKGAIPKVHKKYPTLKLMQTETECGNGSNDWKAAESTFNLMQHYFNNGANSYMYWNMVLNETGKSQWGWKQNSMITIDSKKKEITYNPEFYLMKHFSHFIEEGSTKVGSSQENCLAFRKSDKLVIVYYNSGDTMNKQFVIENMKFDVSLSANSFNTFIVEL